MNTNALAKHYGALSGHERFVLMQAAAMRDDQSEIRRLVDSAAKLVFDIPDFSPFEESWMSLQLCYIADQMYECASFWQAFYLATRHDDGDHMPDLLFALAYRTVILFDGWVRFCEGTQIDPPGTVKDYGGWSFIVDTVEMARALAFTEEQMCAWLAEQHRIEVEQIAKISTAETKAAQFADAYTKLLRQWGRSP